MSSHRGQSLAVKVKFASLRRFASPSVGYGEDALRYCKQSLRRSRLDSRFGISHPPISR
jgi:hypothetical protein